MTSQKKSNQIIKFIDDKKKKLINGYFRNIDFSLPIIPQILVYLCLLFLCRGDYFEQVTADLMISDNFKRIIKGKTLKDKRTLAVCNALIDCNVTSKAIWSFEYTSTRLQVLYDILKYWGQVMFYLIPMGTSQNNNLQEIINRKEIKNYKSTWSNCVVLGLDRICEEGTETIVITFNIKSRSLEISLHDNKNTYSFDIDDDEDKYKLGISLFQVNDSIKLTSFNEE